MESGGGVDVMGIPSFRGEQVGAVGVEDRGGDAASGAVAAVGAFEVVVPQPGLQVVVDVGGAGVEAVSERGAVVQVQHAALEAFDERVQVRGPGRQSVPADPEPGAGAGKGAAG